MALTIPTWFSELQPELLSVARSELGPTWRSAGQLDPYTRLYFIESGTGFVRHHGAEFALRPGWLYLIPAHRLLAYGTPERVVIRWLHCRVGLGGPDLAGMFPFRLAVAAVDPPWTSALFGRLLALYPRGLQPDGVVAPDWGVALETRGILLQLLAALAAPGDEPAPAPDRQRRFRPVLDAMERGLVAPPSVPELAAMLHLTPPAFSRLFRGVFGMPPVRYLQHRRVAAAKPLLRNTARTLADIGCALGFADAFHFSKTFKKVTGLSPREYRRLPAAPPEP